MGSWSVLADLSFSDLLLLVPVAGLPPAGPREDPELVVILGQMRPNNRATAGRARPGGPDRQRVAVGPGRPNACTPARSSCAATSTTRSSASRCRWRTSRCGSRVRSSPSCSGCRLAPLKGPTSHLRADLPRCLRAPGRHGGPVDLPLPREEVATEEAPGWATGSSWSTRTAGCEYASPNATNASTAWACTPPEGRRLTDLDIEESAIEWALASARPVVEEVERRPDVIVLVHCIPLLADDVVTGAMILLRDVTDVRRLDRLLLSKDAAIREVHHRVKNNLQTISSLLSLQARRVDDRAARVALFEAERRVRSIAIVHEILSRDPTDQVPFAEIVVSLVQMAEDSVVSAQPIHSRPATWAT
jgi:two-component sensor histidine kinase